MDPGTGIAILGTALGSKELIVKLLGPTASYLGNGLRAWTEHRVQNVARIFKVASDRLGDDIDQPGQIPPRLLKEVLDDGSYCDDALAAEYYGGLLASGRSEDGRDDRAATYMKLTGQLSTYQIRFHFVVHTVMRKQFLGSKLRLGHEIDLKKMVVLLPASLMNEAMDFVSGECGRDLLLHCAIGLSRLQLVDSVVGGDVVSLNDRGPKIFGRRWQNVSEDGMIVRPTVQGIELFVCAMGHTTSEHHRFLDPELNVGLVPEFTVPECARIVADCSRIVAEQPPEAE